MSLNTISGAGGGESSSSSASVRAAVEDPDSLQSRAMVAILDLLGEGQIGGLVNGAQSIFFNDTPLQNLDGTFNFSGVTWDFRTGTQDQLPIAGFDDIETPYNEGVQVKTGMPHTVTISNPNADQVRVIVTVPSLMEQDTTTGDVHGTSVQYKFSVSSNGGAFVDVASDYVWAGGGSWGVESGMLTALRTSNAAGLSASISLSGDGTAIVQPQYYAFGAWQDFGGRLALDQLNGAGNIGASVTAPMWSEKIRFQVIEAVGVVVEDNPDYFRVLSELTGIPYELTKIQMPAPTLSGGEIQSYIPVATCTISDKTRSRYQRAHLIPLSGNGPWQLRMARLTADSSGAAISNDTYFDSYIEIVNTRMSYPNSALGGILIDSAQFNQIPSRSYLVDGLIIRVPSNYNPLTRAYTGVWDGTFKLASSNNPAWVMYDVLTSNRYGLGQYLNAAQVDKARLYQIGRYCDELVSDGFGGTEPRFTCNTVISQQAEAYKLISDLSSVFRGMGFWAGGYVSFTQDAPSDPEIIFSPANVIDGVFTYMGSARKDRHSVALITYNDPDENYKQKIEYVENPEMVRRYGIRKIESVAFGCTSRGQAHRIGRWMLFTEQYESDVVQHKVGLDSAMVLPGGIGKVHDPFRAGKRLGGRLLAADFQSATLDAPVTLSESGARFSVRMPDGSFVDRTVLEGAGEHSVLTWLNPLPESPVANAVWLLAEQNLQPMYARIIGIAQDSTKNTEFVVSAVEHNPGKYDLIEKGLKLESSPTSSITTAPGIVTDLRVSESLYMMTPALVGARTMLSWCGSSIKYKVTARGENGVKVEQEVTIPSIEFDNLVVGIYVFSVIPYGVTGKPGVAATIRAEIYGKTAPPDGVSGFGLSVLSGAAYLSFRPSTDLDVQVGGFLRVRHSRALAGANWNDATDIGDQIPGMATSALLPLLSGTYLAKWVDSNGFESVNAALIVTDAPSVITMNAVAALDESPTFVGTKTRVGVGEIGGRLALMLDSIATVDEMTDPLDAWPRLSLIGGGVVESGEYSFSETLDLGAVFVSRLTGRLAVQAFDAAESVDEWLDIDTMLSIDGGSVGDVSARVEVRTSSVDPLFGQWSDWQAFHVGDWQGRAFEFRAVLQRGLSSHNIAVTSLQVVVDMPDRVQSGEDLSCPAAGCRVDFASPYYGTPAVAITGQGMQTGDTCSVTSKDRFGFNLIFKNSAGNGVSRTFDYLSRSY